MLCLGVYHFRPSQLKKLGLGGDGLQRCSRHYRASLMYLRSSHISCTSLTNI